MSLFLLTFFSLYGSIHLYFFLKCRSAFTPVAPWSLFILALFLILMLLSPVLVHVIETCRQDGLARFFARTAYFWMGFLFLFFCLSLTTDLYNGLAFLAGSFLTKRFHFPTLSSTAGFLFSSVLALLICIYGMYEARHLKTEHLVIPSAKIPMEIGRFRIVQISDLHLGITTRAGQIDRIIASVRDAKPDLLVCTGDLIDGQPDSFSPQLAPFRQLNPPHGKYAVTGNHEFYVGLERAVTWLKWSGFTVLQGERAEVNHWITLVGVDDAEGLHRHPVPDGSAADRMPELSGRSFTLFLKHRPLIDAKMARVADLQLSGHTHQGQIFPFGLLTRLFFPYHSGCYALPNGFRLYVSRGTGTWGPPIRFLAPPEITVIDLIPVSEGKTGER